MKVKFVCLFFFLNAILFAQGKKEYCQSIAQHRAAYTETFTKMNPSPVEVKDIPSIRFFKVKSKFRLLCDFKLTLDEKPFQMATYDGKQEPYIKYGHISFKLKGQKQTLAVYRSLKGLRMPHMKNKLFLPFKDASNEDKTYGGGRYLDLNISDIQEGKIEVDFNKSYNPYCAYSENWSCPIPPMENHLEIAIKAGERVFNR